MVFCSDSSNPVNDNNQNEPTAGNEFGLIAYCRQPGGSGRHQIYKISEFGTNDVRMIQASIGLNHQDWSPDGQKIACVGYVETDFSTWSIHTFNPNGSELTRLTNTEGVWDNDPRWSSDGTQIAFTRIYPNDTIREEIWVMNSDGSNLHYIGVKGNVGGWSPDGLRLLYSAISLGNSDIYSCNIDGSDILQITNTSENEECPTYSPDGSQIVFSSFWGSMSNHEIEIMNSDGTNRRALTENDSFDSNPRWSPDGLKLVFVSDRHEFHQWEIYTMKTDGTDVRRVTLSQAPATAINPVWRPSL